MLLPGFSVDSFPFFVSCSKETFDLINLSSGRVETLIHGSASNLYGQQAAFFTTKGVSNFDMDFYSVRTNAEGMIESIWYKMTFNSDFCDILREYGQLPIASIKETLDIVKERDALTRTIEHVGLSDAEQKAAIEKF